MKYIMCAKTFPAYHPRAGEPTRFREAILAGRKIHTLRQSAGNRKTGDMVSLREWAGRPYASKQVEFARCIIRVESIAIRRSDDLRLLARADGFEIVADFAAWFNRGTEGPVTFDGVCIYFDDVKQCK